MLTLSENFEKSLELSSEIIKNPHFHEEDFLRESTKLKNKLQQMYDDPGYIASTVFEKICFKNTNLSHPTMGTRSTLENVSLTDVVDYFNQYFSPANTSLIVVGNISSNELRNELEKCFADWKVDSVQLETKQQFSTTQRKIYLVDKPGSAQSEIRMGHIISERQSPDFFHKMVMNTILGGQFSSRINLNLREDKGYTYGANSIFTYYKNTGIFKVATAVNIENTADALLELMKEINGIQADITQEEIDFAKSYLIKSFPSKFETYGQIANSMNLLVVHELEDDYFNKYITEITGVTRDDALKAARAALKPDELNILIVGDKNTLKEQLASIDFEVVALDVEGYLIS